MACLEGRDSAIELHPRVAVVSADDRARTGNLLVGNEVPLQLGHVHGCW